MRTDPELDKHNEGGFNIPPVVEKGTTNGAVLFVNSPFLLTSRPTMFVGSIARIEKVARMW